MDLKTSFTLRVEVCDNIILSKIFGLKDEVGNQEMI